MGRRPRRHGLHESCMTQNGEGVPEHLKTFAVAIFLVPDLRAGYAAVQLNELNAMSLVGP